MNQDKVFRLDYSLWTFEELRALAIQLRIPDAGRKTHRDLLDLLGSDVSRLNHHSERKFRIPISRS